VWLQYVAGKHTHAASLRAHLICKNFGAVDSFLSESMGALVNTHSRWHIICTRTLRGTADCTTAAGRLYRPAEVLLLLLLLPLLLPPLLLLLLLLLLLPLPLLLK
jgi:hypothetical protein